MCEAIMWKIRRRRKRNSSIGSFRTGQRMPDMTSRRAFTAKMSDCCRTIVPICIVRIAHYGRYRCLIVAFDAKRRLSISYCFFSCHLWFVLVRVLFIVDRMVGRNQWKQIVCFPFVSLYCSCEHRCAGIRAYIYPSIAHIVEYCAFRPSHSLVHLFLLSTTELLTIRAAAEKRICAEIPNAQT